MWWHSLAAGHIYVYRVPPQVWFPKNVFKMYQLFWGILVEKDIRLNSLVKKKKYFLLLGVLYITWEKRIYLRQYSECNRTLHLTFSNRPTQFRGKATYNVLIGGYRTHTILISICLYCVGSVLVTIWRYSSHRKNVTWDMRLFPFESWSLGRANSVTSIMW